MASANRTMIGAGTKKHMMSPNRGSSSFTACMQHPGQHMVLPDKLYTGPVFVFGLRLLRCAGDPERLPIGAGHQLS